MMADRPMGCYQCRPAFIRDVPATGRPKRTSDAE
jgi:hypothetical protein